MYYIGSNVQNWPLEGQRALADGHEICVRESLILIHRPILVSNIYIVDTWSHPYLTAVQSESVFAELWYTVSLDLQRLRYNV
jgi:hypothetical protein